jgi:hypothetical protein
MTDEVVAVLTFKSVQTCLDVGGTQSWDLARAHAMRCLYAVCCRNAKHPHVEDKRPHGTAFMVGRIADVIPSTETTGRWLIIFSEYAEIDVPKAWKGWRNPVSYTTLDELGIKLEDLTFRPMPEISEGSEQAERHAPSSRLTIAEAKAALAATFGVEPEAVEITIHG